MNDFRETIATADREGKRKWVYPAVAKGRYSNARRYTAYLLLMIYLTLPWVKIGGTQAVHFDIVQRKFVVFGSTFWATDSIYLALILAFLGLSLFFFTSLLGRVWCGWACPQTVFLEFVFRPIERWIEGGPAEQRKLDAKGWDLEKVRKKGTKYLIFTFIAWWLASTFLAYLVGRERLFVMMSHSPLENFGTFLLNLFVMGVVLFEFGWFREQFCSVLCPYARFQSVLIDSHSLTVGYDTKRGEPRGKLRNVEGKERGDCVDCGLCVRVCPAGIDIRNGIQLECIHCAACVDACDSVMVKIGRPQGLIRYDTEEGLLGNTTQILRPRVVLYGAGLTALLGIFIASLSIRTLSELQIVRGGKTAFTELPDGSVSNQLTLHISNKSDQEREYAVSLVSPSEAGMTVPVNPYKVAAGEKKALPIFISLKKERFQNGTRELVLKVKEDGRDGRELRYPLLGP